MRRTLDYAQVTKTVADFAEEKQYKSVEGLAEGIAQVRQHEAWRRPAAAAGS